MTFGRPFIDETGLVYNKEKGTVMFKQNDEKITFKMPHTMKVFERTRLMGLSIDSIPPSAYEENFGHGRTHYYQSLLIGDEYRLYLMRRSLEVLRKFQWTILGGRFNQLWHGNMTVIKPSQPIPLENDNNLRVLPILLPQQLAYTDTPQIQPVLDFKLGITFDDAPVAIPITIFSSNPDSIASPLSQITSFAASVSVMYAALVVTAIMCSITASQLPTHSCIINSYLVIDLPVTMIDLLMA
ncbi:hypothetical protein Tco_0204087 [Tanacetum coccineum]